ncbi:hypothetical protein JB92DRAFT_2998338 [Gautieria morchelliformis]|nr:hypothetical protein JB92DRAFT_2998338 [Gautieria morchelliformis]
MGVLHPNCGHRCTRPTVAYQHPEMVQPGRKLLWHPTRQNRFVVGGGEPIGHIKVYDWDGRSDITEVTTLGDLQQLKCFALSPHPLQDDLVAVGSGLGNVDLLHFSTPHPPNTIRGPSTVPLPARALRPCNALAFSHFDPNYLAVGFDKARNEASLVIWDIETSSLSLSKPPARDQGTFNRPEPLLPRSTNSDRNIIQQWAIDAVTAIAFLPQTTSLLVAGVSQRWLKLFDLRVGYSSTNPLSTAAKSVHGISVDPFDPNRIGSFGDDGVARVWDCRRFSSPLLTFTERDAVADGGNPRGSNAISSLEFSSNRRGMLATLEKDAMVVRFWDTVNATFPEERDTPSNQPESAQEEIHASKISKLARLPWSSPAVESSSPVSNDHTTRGEQVILRNTRTSARFLRPLSSFVYMPGNPSRVNEYSVAVVTKDGDLDMQTMCDPPQPRWSSRGELSIASGQSYQVYQPFRDEPVAEPWTLVPHAPRSQMTSPYGSVRVRKEGSKEPVNSRDVSGGMLLNVHSPRTYSPASMKYFTLDKSPAPDATPRPGQFLLRPENEPSEKRGRPSQKEEQKTFSRSLSRGKLSSDERSSRRVITDDISMVIRRRVLKGYGLENVVHNAEVARSDNVNADILYELWTWIERSRNLLSQGASRIHGFEFANQGVLGIWEGLQPVARTPSLERNQNVEPPQVHEGNTLLSLPDEDADGYRTPNRRRRRRSLRRSHSPLDQLHGDFSAAVHALNIRRGYDRASVAKISVSTSRLAQRRFCLSLCGWNQGDDELLRAVARWEKEGQLTRAACWLLFTDQHEKAIECLMRSDDERLRIMSGTIAALIPQRGTSTRLREHYNRLIVRIEDPYIRVILTHIALEDWSEILQEESLPLRERLAIAFRFLDDRALSSYLRYLTDRFRVHGDIEGIIVTGLTPLGLDVLQGYVDSTGDVQSASILAAFVCPGTFKDARAERWLEAYRSLLDSWKLFHHRCQLDISRGKIIKEAMTKEDVLPFDWVAPQLAIKCGFCSKAINARAPMAGPGGRTRVNCCQACGRSLPRCSLCLSTLGLAFDSARDKELAEGPESKDTIDDAIVFCQTCKHGGHVSHVLEWFYGTHGSEGQAHDECPVAGCDCRCALE